MKHLGRDAWSPLVPIVLVVAVGPLVACLFAWRAAAVFPDRLVASRATRRMRVLFPIASALLVLSAPLTRLGSPRVAACCTIAAAAVAATGLLPVADLLADFTHRFGLVDQAAIFRRRSMTSLRPLVAAVVALAPVAIVDIAGAVPRVPGELGPEVTLAGSSLVLTPAGATAVVVMMIGIGVLLILLRDPFKNARRAVNRLGVLWAGSVTTMDATNLSRSI